MSPRRQVLREFNCDIQPLFTSVDGKSDQGHYSRRPCHLLIGSLTGAQSRLVITYYNIRKVSAESLRPMSRHGYLGPPLTGPRVSPRFSNSLHLLWTSYGLEMVSITRVWSSMQGTNSFPPSTSAWNSSGPHGAATASRAQIRPLSVAVPGSGGALLL